MSVDYATLDRPKLEIEDLSYECNIHVHFRNDIDFAFGIISPPADTSLKNIQLLRGLQNLTSLGTGIQRAKKSHFIELQKAAFGHKLRSLTVHSLGRIANGEDPTPFTEYPWSRAPEACKASQLTRLELLNFCICTSLDAEAYWLNTFSWSLLTHVTLTCASFLTSSIIGERLLNLKSLTLNLESQSDHGPGCPGSINRARIKKFLLRCRRLSELELISCTSAVDEQLLIHLGKTLTALKLHEYEIRGVVGKRVLSTAQLEKLGQHCPLVRKLSIDVAYMKGWPYATFDAISKHLWFVRSLELNFELYGREVFRDSQPTLKTARDIWDYLRSSSNRAHSAPTAPTVEESQHTHLALEALDISVGPYRKPDMMYSSDHDAVMQMLPGYQRTYQVRLVGKDQNELPEHVQVTCVEFEETKRKQTEDLGYHEHWESYVRQVEKIAENGMESLPESVA
ncbi:hypothetical protein PRK78_006393 [Emydomyces testavorans]|uniref:Uncharacterized protein n=1 Tax=Emydomyces testavorans TaxID=2070801 RepID=A0AAF0DQ50_9EURO|nr:hypothetical protein PRK78_006393 [Emydomyces testavorans]